MPGYKQWSDGDVLLPSELDEYIVGQTLMRFANAAARDAVLSSPVDGMHCFLSDTGIEYIYANGAWAPMLQIVRKTTSESVTSSTTIQNDDQLLVTLPIGLYQINLTAGVSGSTTGDFKCQWAFSGTQSFYARTSQGPGIASSDAQGGSTNAMRSNTGHTLVSAESYGCDGTNQSYIQEGILMNVTAQGDLQFQWAQNTSNGTATTVNAGTSYIIVQRLA